MNYEHRMMRCKLDRSARIGKRRYRPGEILEEGHTPTDAFEEVERKPETEPERKPIVRLVRVKPPTDVKVIGLEE